MSGRKTLAFLLLLINLHTYVYTTLITDGMSLPNAANPSTPRCLVSRT
jgi:hypothetical protein